MDKNPPDDHEGSAADPIDLTEDVEEEQDMDRGGSATR